jgi:hypothetical protein
VRNEDDGGEMSEDIIRISSIEEKGKKKKMRM